MAPTLVLKQQCSECFVSRLLPFREHPVWILNTCQMSFVLLYICFLFGYALTSDHTPHMELARQRSYVNQLFSDEHTKSFGIKAEYTPITVCQIGQYTLLLACILLNAWSKINERPHDMALNWMLLVYYKRKKKITFLSFIYICIAVGDPVNTRGGFGSH